MQGPLYGGFCFAYDDFMVRRSSYRIGDYLVQDDLSGEQVWASECVKDYRGNFVHRKNLHLRNPQDFVRPINDGAPVTEARPRNTPSPPVPYSAFVGNTNVPVIPGAADHLFTSASDFAIPDMVIGTTFIVR